MLITENYDTVSYAKWSAATGSNGQKEKRMPISKRAVLTAGAGFVIGMSCRTRAGPNRRRQKIVRSCDDGRRRGRYDRPKGRAASQIKRQNHCCPTRDRNEKGSERGQAWRSYL